MNKTEPDYKEVLTKDLKPYENNARTHSDEQVNQIVESIKEFGFTNPLLIDENNLIIAGHGRLMAAHQIGIEKLPCMVIKDLSEDQKRALILADNKIALNAGWDQDLLGKELQALIDAGYDVSQTGFTEDEIDDIIVFEGDEVEEDDLPDYEEQSVAREGEIWILGDHRVMCGDSTDPQNIIKLLEDGKADMVFTDPPYLMDFDGGIHADGSKSFNASHGKIKNDKMSEKEGDEFLDKINKIIFNFTKGAFYITFYRLGIAQYLKSMERVGLKKRSVIIWNKGNHTLSNSDYMSMYEPIFYGWVEDHNFYGGKNGRDIWDIKRTAKNDLHPTMKPVELCQKAIQDGSKRYDIVMDLFGGSGSTLIACESLDRKCRTIELDPAYVDVIIKRWQDFTEKDAILEGTDKTFKELYDERA